MVTPTERVPTSGQFKNDKVAPLLHTLRSTAYTIEIAHSSGVPQNLIFPLDMLEHLCYIIERSFHSNQHLGGKDL
jgi:hypothetical protein